MFLKIKELRTKKNISQEELALKTGISKRMVFDYENEKIDIPVKKLQLIARILEVSIFDLICIENELNVVNEPAENYNKIIPATIDIKDKLIKLLEDQNKILLNDKYFLQKIVEQKLNLK